MVQEDNGRWIRRSQQGLFDAGELCGIKFQLDYFKPMEAAIAANPERHLVADVTHADMKAEYERLVAADPAYADALAAEVAEGSATGGFDPFSLFAMVHETGTEGQRRLAGIACRGVMNFATSHAGGENTPKERIILDYRNKRLADFIVSPRPTRSTSPRRRAPAGHAEGFAGAFGQFGIESDSQIGLKVIQGMRR